MLKFTLYAIALAALVSVAHAQQNPSAAGGNVPQTKEQCMANCVAERKSDPNAVRYCTRRCD
jgi:hypothetical protein